MSNLSARIAARNARLDQANQARRARARMRRGASTPVEEREPEEIVEEPEEIVEEPEEPVEEEEAKEEEATPEGEEAEEAEEAPEEEASETPE